MSKKLVIIEDEYEFVQAWLSVLAAFPGLEVEVIDTAEKMSAGKLASLIIDNAYFILDGHLWGKWSGERIATALVGLGYPIEKIVISSRDPVNGFNNLAKVYPNEDHALKIKLLIRRVEAFINDRVSVEHSRYGASFDFLTKHGRKGLSDLELAGELAEMSDEEYSTI